MDLADHEEFSAAVLIGQFLLTNYKNGYGVYYEDFFDDLMAFCERFNVDFKKEIKRANGRRAVRRLRVLRDGQQVRVMIDCEEEEKMDKPEIVKVSPLSPLEFMHLGAFLFLEGCLLGMLLVLN